MATIAAIREGIATNLKTHLGASTVQVSPYMLENPTPPTIQVMGPDVIEYDQAFQRGMDDMLIIVQGFAGGPSDRGAQVKLDQWLAPSGATSVKAAIELDNTLAGLVFNVRVISASGYRIYNLDSRGPALGADWTVSVKHTGS